MIIELSSITDVVIENIDNTDAPDYTNAFMVSGFHSKEERPLTETELDYINDNHYDWVHEQILLGYH